MDCQSSRPGPAAGRTSGSEPPRRIAISDQDQIGLRKILSAVWSHVRLWLPLLTGFASAIGLRLVLVANTDVSWLITLSEKMLDGQRLYVDLIEVNPPASVFLYLPLVALARALA